MAHQQLHCESVTVLQVIPSEASIRPGAVVLCLESVEVILPIRVFESVRSWDIIHNDIIYNNVCLPKGIVRGPPLMVDYFPPRTDAFAQVPTIRKEWR